MNNFELQAMRRLLFLEVSEAAELIAKVSNRTWQYWEAGRSPVPGDVEFEIYGISQWRTQLINELIEEYPWDSEETMQIKWYHTYEAFLEENPNSNKILWRLHQSVVAFIFAESNNIELSADAPLNRESYLYKWLNGLTEEQIEHARQNEIFKSKGIE